MRATRRIYERQDNIEVFTEPNERLSTCQAVDSKSVKESQAIDFKMCENLAGGLIEFSMGGKLI